MTALKKQSGFSLVEVILAVALFGLFATALIGLLMNSYGSDIQAKEKDAATIYAQQGIDAVRSIRRQAWNFLVNGSYGLDQSIGHWQFSGSSDFLAAKFTCVTTIGNACRDVGKNLVDCVTPGSQIDLETKKVTVVVSYTAVNGVLNKVILNSYLTNWQSSDWRQTDWVGGSGQTVWADPTKYNADDSNINIDTGGQLSLASVSADGCGIKVWPFTMAADYNYDPNKIEVVDGLAQLKNQGTVQTGSLINTNFNADASNWTYSDWDQGGGEVNVAGSYAASGGNPGGIVNVSFPSGKNDELGGYWYQAFETTVSNPTVTVNFDYNVTDYNSAPLTFKVYVFVDSSPGTPVIGQEVWSSGEINSTQSWTNQANIDVASRVTNVGTYYVKFAVWVETPNSNTGPLTVNFDNLNLSWSGSTFGYPTNQPTINPVSSDTVNNLDTWSSFTEVATKNGGEIYYQLSDNNGSTWQYWNGSTWTTATAANTNTAAVINSNISSFSTSTGQLMFKAFLASDGSQAVSLDSVTIGWGPAMAGGSGYQTSGYLISSAFDMGAAAAVNLIKWSQIIPVCSPSCSIKFQVRTAPDNGGSPGTWSNWYGADGSGFYFTDSSGSIISPDLNFKQWVQYRAELSGDGTKTPILNEVIINYTP
ncbi:MAG: type II secretion system protein [Patescibacteria group bacterium]|nr:type II secretion system protein [Patescibacteria group bacterium]